MTISVDILSDHTHVILTWSSGTLYTAYGRYTDIYYSYKFLC